MTHDSDGWCSGVTLHALSHPATPRISTDDQKHDRAISYARARVRRDREGERESERARDDEDKKIEIWHEWPSPTPQQRGCNAAEWDAPSSLCVWSHDKGIYPRN